MTEVRLTEFSHGAGCACKLGPDELSRVMETVRGHNASAHPDLLVGVAGSDDAGVFSLGNGMALVQTVDIFTPVVDDPGDWGRIAAANALSDVYAMGGSPLTALQYLAWPRGTLDFDVAGQVVAGGMEVMERAGCTVVGGHSIDSPEPTYGFAVTGFGLLGHLREICLGSGVGAVIEQDRVPVLSGARELLDLGMWAGGSQRNLDSVSSFIDSSVDLDELKLLADAQTSGGILVALPPDSVEAYLDAVPGSVSIGHITAGTGIIVTK